MLYRLFLISAMLLSLSCQPELQKLEFQNSTNLIRGQTDFKPRSFLLQATIADIVDNATVSLIDATSNISVETGLTDRNGDFTINPNASVLNNEGGIYWLEANKRHDLIGAEALFLRTVIKRENGRFYSITNGINNPDDFSLINAVTTAVVIADSLDNTIEPADLIGTVNKTIPVALSANSTLSAIEKIKIQVETNLTNNTDPLDDDTYVLVP